MGINLLCLVSKPTIRCPASQSSLLTNHTVLFGLLEHVLSNGLLFGAPLHSAFDNMGETSGYVIRNFVPNYANIKFNSLKNHFCPTGQTSEIGFASLESTDSEFKLFEGDIAGINGFDILAGKEVILLTTVIKIIL